MPTPRANDELRDFGSTRATRKLSRAGRARQARSKNPDADDKMLERELKRLHKAHLAAEARFHAEQELPPHLLLFSDEEDVGDDDDAVMVQAEVWFDYWADRRLDLEGGFDDDEPAWFEEFDQDLD